MNANKDKTNNAYLFEKLNSDDEVQDDITSEEDESYWGRTARILIKNKWALISMICILLCIVMSFVAPLMSSHDYKTQDLSRAYLPPKIPILEQIHWLPFDGYADGIDQYEAKGIEESFWFGTDKFGRDQWTRIWFGTMISLFIAFSAALIDLVIGIIYGAISGYFGRRVDSVMQRIIEVLVGIPNLVIVILMIMIMKPGVWSIIIAIALSGWIGMSRIVRSQVLKIKEQEYVLASRALGLSHQRILRKDIISNSTAQIIVTLMFTMPNAVFFEAFLSFIGLGLPSPMASLGTVINAGFDSLQTNPYLVFFPSIIISILLVSFNLLGDGLRDAMDPKMRQE